MGIKESPFSTFIIYWIELEMYKILCYFSDLTDEDKENKDKN